MKQGFADHFSPLAVAYAAYRPVYPDALFDYLAAIVPAHRRVWDCATGSGQAARQLARHFAQVCATDASVAQLRQARQHPAVHYYAALAEAGGLADASCDLVVVAQALHWFDLDAFYREVRRVLVPQGVLAVWAYGPVRVDDTPELAAVVQRFYMQVIGPFWPPERRLVETGYRDVPFPFRELKPAPFAMSADWSLDTFLGYVRTWSATTRFCKQKGFDPVTELQQALTPLWGAGARSVHWPLALRVGQNSPL